MAKEGTILLKKLTIKYIRRLNICSTKTGQRGNCSDPEIHKNDNHYRGSSSEALGLMSGLK